MKPTYFYGFQVRDFAGFTVKSANFRSFKTAFISWFHLVSATDDWASQDADKIVTIAREMCAAMGIVEHIEHKRYEGEHNVTQERFDDIVHWLIKCVE